MKHIKKRIEDEGKRIADADRDFLENEIYKRVDENVAKQKVQRKGIRRLIVSASALCVISAVIIGSVFVIKQKNTYLDNYETKKSDIEQVNANLTNTQLVGDFSVIMTYKMRKGTPVYFSAENEKNLSEESYVSSAVQIIVEKEYSLKDNTVYKDKLNYLGYEVNICKTENIDATEELTIREYAIRAYMDTGAERYLINYHEDTINETDSFSIYMESIIKQK